MASRPFASASIITGTWTVRTLTARCVADGLRPLLMPKTSGQSVTARQSKTLTVKETGQSLDRRSRHSSSGHLPMRATRHKRFGEPSKMIQFGTMCFSLTATTPVPTNLHSASSPNITPMYHCKHRFQATPRCGLLQRQPSAWVTSLNTPGAKATSAPGSNNKRRRTDRLTQEEKVPGIPSSFRLFVLPPGFLEGSSVCITPIEFASTLYHYIHDH